MAKKKQKTSTSKFSISKIRETLKNKTLHAIIGIGLIFFAVLMLGGFSSFLFTWQEDFSNVEDGFISLMSNPDYKVKNVLGGLGAKLGDLFIYRSFGISAYLISWFLLLYGLKVSLGLTFKNFRQKLGNTLFLLLWLPIAFSYIFPNQHILGGANGFYSKQWLFQISGSIGTPLILFFTLLGFVILKFKWTPESMHSGLQSMINFFKIKAKRNIEDEASENIENSNTQSQASSEEDIETEQPISIDLEEKTDFEPIVIEEPKEEIESSSTLGGELEIEQAKGEEETVEEATDLEIEANNEEEVLSEKEVNRKVKEFGEYDPKLDLSRFKLPPVDLLIDYGSSNITINQEELEANKNRIIETLNNYKIEISKIKATIGPTVTLYEIVPAAGVRISKIKSLEDDIALSLSALGIRIIAPIPGRGTIGIEVPSTNPQMVPMRNMIKSEKFQKSDMELPIAFGKTINNETFMADLTKMPHLLMAGATGQGKSVGLNVILTSILYKKHPSQVKFILVDPKKVELTLFNKIERHYLAKLPDTEEAIITDTTKVVHTLNSLCIEMDNRYDLLKKAMCRNLKEYNAKFIKRKLNPEEGHRFLPYIVLVIDEFADLIMTAGKEVETPIARLAQLARAIGIHLIVATQRPSVNVITGIIKANFPARAAFRVTSKIDSRTILDAGGADQLIGKGDMLIAIGSDLIRVQCAFVDTPEVEEITDFIGNQQAYPEAYQLPEYVGEDEGSSLDIDISERDKLFEDAARVVIIHQQGSASLLQRKLKLGYNRAGRIVDQLEAAGIIGPFEGSKARQVLLPDELSLEQLLKNEKEN
tara:strand:- start:94446 stop:96902 length:2457 start_codon:yes stop_codon:yes gene_type:complete